MVIQIISYARVSTRSQASNYSLPTQSFIIKRYAQEQGWVVTQEIQEVGTAYKQVPPKMQVLVEEADSLPSGSKIIVSLVDRFSRCIEYGNLILDHLKERGVEVIEVYSDQRSTTDDGRAYFTRKIQSAQDESENKAARVQMHVEFKESGTFEDHVDPDYQPSDDDSDGYDDGENEWVPLSQGDRLLLRESGVDTEMATS